MEGADLSWAQMEGADLRNAQMQWADVREARMEGADLTGADLTFTNLHRIQEDRSTRWQGANRGAARETDRIRPIATRSRRRSPAPPATTAAA